MKHILQQFTFLPSRSSTNRIFNKMKKERKFKRWSKEEEKMVIDYLLENLPFEKPTSRLFYTQLIKDRKLNATWSVVRGKVRHLKDHFEKTFISFKNKHLVPENKQRNFTKEMLYKLCPFYDQLLQLYTLHQNDENSNLYSKLTKMEQNTTDTFLRTDKSQFLIFTSKPNATNSTIDQSKSSTPTNSRSPSPVDHKVCQSPTRQSTPTLIIKEEDEESNDNDPLALKNFSTARKKFKKWSRSDVKQIVDFLQENPNFEHPTARIYYTQLLNETSIDATWDLVRWKVRYMRLRLKHAKSYLDQYNTDLSPTDEVGIPHDRNLERLCPFFKELSEIFKNNTNELVDDENSRNKFEIKNKPKNRICIDKETSDTSNSSDEFDDMTDNQNLLKRKYDIVQKKLKLKEYEMQQQHEIQLRKLEIEEKRMELDMELKKRKLEVEESLGKYELDLKYSMSNNNYKNDYQ